MMKLNFRSQGSTGLSADFWKFWTGQVISVLGSSFTGFAIPLLIYRLTHSALNLGLTMTVEMLPYLMFGLVIGAWVDRVDRKRLMITVNVAMAVLIVSIPVASGLNHLSLALIYAVAFLASTLNIFFSSAEFAAVPKLVGADDLVTANGRIQASYSAAQIAGPILAGLLTSILPIATLLSFDSASYLVAAAALILVRVSFNSESDAGKERASVLHDVAEGLRYVLGHPVLRNISLMMAIVNFVSATTGAQIVLFAKEHLAVSNAQLGILFAAQGAGVVLTGLTAGWFRSRWSFSVVALGALMVSGALTVAYALAPWYWLVVPLLGLTAGFGILFNINTTSLRQQIVPNQMLGRVMSIAGVLAWSAIPLGALLGAAIISWTHNVVGVYAGIGVLTVVIPACFWFSPLGHAEDYIERPPEVVSESLVERAAGS
jgi:MFS family permease